jgi:hypothetical protein
MLMYAACMLTYAACMPTHAAGKKRPYDDARLLPSHNTTKRQRAWQEQVAEAASFACVFALVYQ